MDLVDEEMSSVDQKEISQQIIEEWLMKFNESTLTQTNFEEHWRKWVPKIYGPSLNQDCLHLSFNKESEQFILINTLEEFICNGDSKNVLNDLNLKDKPPSVCSRLFKLGEPTYSCRECGFDNTCVLCVDCFKNSEHRFHKYKMGTSAGGGCCDCGDTEAWKRAPFCRLHDLSLNTNDCSSSSGSSSSTDAVPTITILPEDLKQRTHLVFESVLWYAFRLLSNDQISDLKLGDTFDDFFNIDTYCTILYNDEIHTFEQVITTLSRVLKCNQRESIEFVTNIDREGRTVVKCSTFLHCTELKQDIEKYTSRHGNNPLKVLVNHSYIIAHQIFAMKLLNWLQHFLSHGDCFRSIFAQVILEAGTTSTMTSSTNDLSILRGILVRDSSLWKSARTQWHHLLISGMLTEYENKKQLAKVFARNYGQVMKDFIKDDHDHSFSISSLSVQLFTAPTLAHYLITYDDILYILLNAFMSECTRKCNKNGKLEFERSPSSHTFKRAQYMLYDLRYLLSSIPDQWNDDLRRSFLHACSILLNLLTKMQGMDSVRRQIGQHMEYEPEWESAFNLHIKLASCISLIIEWCSKDRIVLIKAYRAILKKLEENPCYEHGAWEVQELCDHSVSCIIYNVSTMPVSIHLPLSRFLAGLHLYLENYNLHFDGPEFQVTKPTPVEIIEPVLRNQVMIAQVHAGMWRRNGYALLNQLYFYHNVKCRTEMLDRDISLLQMGASLIESNEFLIHLLYKYDLIHWIKSNSNDLKTTTTTSEDDTKIISLIEEFLQLLIVIIGERYMPGLTNITTKDRIKKEIIQYLCIKPLPHSELNKIIPDDISNETALDDVIDELATFQKPNTQSSGKGVYKLKDEYYNEYNVFFYHYTREELSKSEEAQRNRHKLLNELECCPPPKLLKLNESFNMIVNLLQCDVMLELMRTILKQCNNLKIRTFSELQLHKILHLIGYALNEEESNNYPFFKFIQNSNKFQIYELMQELIDSPRLDAHKDLLKWTIQKFQQVSNDEKKLLSDNNDLGGNNEVIVDNEKEDRAKRAAERRAKIMKQMEKMQKSFMKENAKLFEESNIETGSLPKTTAVAAASTTQQAMDIEQEPIALGINQTTRLTLEKTYTCILCQEEEKLAVNGPTLVLAAFVQQATVLCRNKNNTMLDVSKHDPLYLNSNLGPAPYTSTCGHVMHSECWRKYFNNVMLREHRRPYRLRHPASFDVDKQEFLCPLCECLSNTILPLVPSLNILQPSYPKNSINFDQFLSCIDIILNKKMKVCHGIFTCDVSNCKNLHCDACINATSDTNIETLSSSPNSSSTSKCEFNCVLQAYQVFYSCPDLTSNDFNDLNETFEKLFPKDYPNLEKNLYEMMVNFTQVAYTRGLNTNRHPSDKRLAPMVWKTLSYTIHAIEILLRDSNKPLLGHLSSRQRDCIENLVKLVGILGSTFPNSVILNHHALNLLSILFENNDDDPCILQWDSLGFLIPLTFSLPSLSNKHLPTPIPTGGNLEHFTLRIIFICHIIKILITINDLTQIMEIEEDEQQQQATDVSIINTILKILGIYKDGLNLQSIWKHIQNACIPFLRTCCLFYHYLTDIPAPTALQEINGDTFINMCTYLDLPQNPNDLFNSLKIMKLIEKWSKHKEISIYLNEIPFQYLSEPLPINHLIDLPNDYSDLINTVSTFTCPYSDEDSRNPTMCLVCGEILCSQSYCCQTELNKIHVGACNYHAHVCGAGVGIFLRVRECEILFLASPFRGCFVSPPYLDDYGETDQGLRRGNPLRLCRERYKKLETLWLSHSIHEEIARAIESSNHIITTQWHHL